MDIISVKIFFGFFMMIFFAALGVVGYFQYEKGYKYGYEDGYNIGKLHQSKPKKTYTHCIKCGKEIKNATGNWKYCEDCRNEIFKNNAKVTMKSVNQYDLDGNFIKTYSSLSEAHRQTGISISNISKNIRGQAKKAGGYIWKYNKGE